MKPLSHTSRPRLPILKPDGVELRVDWWGVELGMSVFFPAVRTDLLIAALRIIAELTDYELVWRERVEGGKLGVRVWRIA